MSACAVDVTDPATWRGTRRPLGSATGLHPSLYTDPGVHDAELDRVFERAWVCVGLTAELDEPGTVLARSIGRRSILLTRGGNGRLRGFVNACRHRGTELVEGDCTVRGTIRCPYHRWGYDLDGTLVSTPRFADVPAARAASTDGLDLLPVRVDAMGCLLFACLDPGTPPLATWLGDLPDRLAGYELDRWHRADGLTVGIEANWKLISENYQEYYHLPWVHPGLATVSRVDDHYRYQGPGMYCGQTTTPVTDGDGSTWLSLPPMAGLDASDSVSGRHIAIFPNVLISILPNHAFVLRLEPDGPGRTREHCTWLLPPGDAVPPAERDAGFAALRQFWLDVNGEDIDIVQRSQRGLSRGAAPAGPLAPRFEEPLRRFHNMLADLCTSAELAELAIPAGDRPGADVELGGKPNPHPPSIETEILRG
ncbi:MAG: aromatic ring-hydroxylating dioxygenase subunit alpha [Actinomycetota bacterium]